jgi:hypothetical protein
VSDTWRRKQWCQPSQRDAAAAQEPTLHGACARKQTHAPARARARRHLGRGHDGEGQHDAVGVLLADLGDEEGAHAGAGAAAERVGELEALEAIAGLGLLAHHVEHGVDELGALGVVALGPVVARAGLAEHKVVGAEDLAVGARAHGVHRAGLEVHEHRARHVAPAGRLIEVHVDALELEVGVAVVGAGGVDAVLVRDDLPELGPDLVAALASLDVDDLAHAWWRVFVQTVAFSRSFVPLPPRRDCRVYKPHRVRRVYKLPSGCAGSAKKHQKWPLTGKSHIAPGLLPKSRRDGMLPRARPRCAFAGPTHRKIIDYR